MAAFIDSKPGLLIGLKAIQKFYRCYREFSGEGVFFLVAREGLINTINCCWVGLKSHSFFESIMKNT